MKYRNRCTRELINSNYEDDNLKKIIKSEFDKANIKINYLQEQLDTLKNNNLAEKISDEYDKKISKISEENKLIFDIVYDKKNIVENILNQSYLCDKNKIINSCDNMYVQDKNKSKILSETNSDKNLFFTESVISNKLRLLQQLEDIINENIYLKNSLKNINYSDSDSNYNQDWLENFDDNSYSLDNDGTYEYYEDNDMKNDYYNGDLPKTKIVKIGSDNDSKVINADEINDIIKTESKKIIKDEVSKINDQSDIVTKAWLANSQKLNELANLIKEQEKEIRRLSELSDKINSNSKIEPHELESFNNLKNDAESHLNDNDNLSNEVDYLKSENERLKKLFDINFKNNPSNSASKQNAEKASFEKKPVLKSHPQRKKRKQQYFFEIRKHDSPKLTKADIEKRK